jgi:alpha-L-fucosidase
MMKYFFLVIFSFFIGPAYGQFGIVNKLVPPDRIADKMDEWFTGAKIGVFIHWGIYATDGTVESWPMQEGVEQAKAYMAQAKRFDPKHYDPEAWADLFKAFGAKYVVITAKHHDGVALWDTHLPHGLSVVKNTPYKKDILGPLFKALKERGIKCGAYFSNPDWNYPDYPRFTGDSMRYDPEKDTARWNKFMDFYKSQLKELMTKYKPDLLWFDMPEYNAHMMQASAVRKMLLQYNPHLIINSRLKDHGDYNNAEQDLFASRPESRYWELALPVTPGFWGYRAGMHSASDPQTLITLFARVISQGGNMLFDIGPDGNGEIIPAQMQCLKNIGRWVHRHQEAIYGTREGIGFNVCGFPTTYSKDSSILYVFVPHGDRVITIQGINTYVHASIVGSGTALKPESAGIPECYGWFAYKIPVNEEDEYMTVIKLQSKSGQPIRERIHGGYIK